MTSSMIGSTGGHGSGGWGRLGLLAAAAGGITAAVVLVVLAGPPTSSPDLPEGPFGSAAAHTTGQAGTVGPDPQIDLTDPEQVCAGFAAALFTAERGDTWPGDSHRRAAAYTTSELATAIANEQGRLPVPDQQPAGPATVTSYVGDHMRPDTDRTAFRTVLVHVTDRSGTESRHVVYCTLHQAGHGWRVGGYEQERSLP